MRAAVSQYRQNKVSQKMKGGDTEEGAGRRVSEGQDVATNEAQVTEMELNNVCQVAITMVFACSKCDAAFSTEPHLAIHAATLHDEGCNGTYENIPGLPNASVSSGGRNPSMHYLGYLACMAGCGVDVGRC